MEDEQLQKLIGAAIAYISIHPRSEAEIRAYLAKKGKRMGASQSALVGALERLKELQMVDDMAYARLFVESRMRSRPKGERRIRLELRTKGVQEDIIELVCHELFTVSEGQKTEVILARRVIAKKLHLWNQLPQQAWKQHIFRYLAMRGFSTDTIHTIIDEQADIHYNRGN